MKSCVIMVYSKNPELKIILRCRKSCLSIQVIGKGAVAREFRTTMGRQREELGRETVSDIAPIVALYTFLGHFFLGDVFCHFFLCHSP